MSASERSPHHVPAPGPAAPRLPGAASAVFALALAMMLALVLPGCSGQPAEPKAERLKVALLVSEGPELAGLGQAYKNVAQMVRTETAGGVERPLGRAPLELQVIVHGEDVESALRALRQAASEGNGVIIGGPVSRQALPMAALAEELRVPFISPGATHPDLVGRRAHVFRTPYSDAFQAKALARLCRDSGAATAAVFFNRTDIYSSGLADEFERAFRALGGQVLVDAGYVSNGLDLGKALLPVAKARPDVLFLPGYHTEVPEQARRARALGFKGGIVGTDGWDMLSGELPPELIGARFLVPWRPGAPMSAKSKEFLERYTAAFGQQPTSVEALVYDAFALAFLAARTARALDAQALRQELAKVREFHGVAGRALYQDGTPERDALVMEVSSRGLQYVETITPEAVAGR